MNKASSCTGGVILKEICRWKDKSDLMMSIMSLTFGRELRGKHEAACRGSVSDSGIMRIVSLLQTIKQQKS